MQSTYIWGFWEDHRLRKMWTEGKLEFVLWDSTAECVGHLKCMQVNLQSHGNSCQHTVDLLGRLARDVSGVVGKSQPCCFGGVLPGRFVKTWPAMMRHLQL